MKKLTHPSKRPAAVDCLGLGIMPLDFLYEVDRYPAVGTKADALALTIQGGGPVPNVLVGLKRLGHTVALMAAIGDDLPGQLGTQELTREGIDTKLLIRKRGESDTAGGFVERGTGRRTIVLGRKTRVRSRDIVLSKLPRPRIIHLDGRDLEAAQKLARWGRRVGAAICFDIGSIRNDVSPIFGLVDHLIVADSYALTFTGCRTARRAVERLAQYCPGTVIVTEGTQGSIGLEDGHWVRQPAFRVREADTTGAGDAFHTGYLHGWLLGHDLGVRMRLGAAVAALKCTQRGARAGAPTLAKVNEFLKRKRPIHA